MRSPTSPVSTIPAGTYVVTGAGGLVGNHALLRLAGRRDVVVRAVFHERRPRVVADNITTVGADLTDPGVCSRLFDGADYLLAFAGIVRPGHVMAADPVTPAERTFEIVSNTLTAAAATGVRRIVWLSSTTGYPNRPGRLMEDEFDHGEPSAPWREMGRAVRELERLSRRLAADTPTLETLAVLRPSLIYGEFGSFDPRSAHFLPALVKRVADRERPIRLRDGGKGRRDLIHADDVVTAVLASLFRVQGMATFNIGAGEVYAVSDVLDAILQIDDFDDAELIIDGDHREPGFDRRINTEKAEKILGFKPEITLEEGIRRMLLAYRKQTDASATG